jgi:hypothetical protein
MHRGIAAPVVDGRRTGPPKAALPVAARPASVVRSGLPHRRRAPARARTGIHPAAPAVLLTWLVYRAPSAALAMVEPALEMHRYCDSVSPPQIRVLGRQPSNGGQHRFSLLVRQYRDRAMAQREVG